MASQQLRVTSSRVHKIGRSRDPDVAAPFIHNEFSIIGRRWLYSSPCGLQPFTGHFQHIIHAWLYVFILRSASLQVSCISRHYLGSLLGNARCTLAQIAGGRPCLGQPECSEDEPRSSAIRPGEPHSRGPRDSLRNGRRPHRGYARRERTRGLGRRVRKGSAPANSRNFEKLLLVDSASSRRMCTRILGECIRDVHANARESLRGYLRRAGPDALMKSFTKRFRPPCSFDASQHWRERTRRLRSRVRKGFASEFRIHSSEHALRFFCVCWGSDGRASRGESRQVLPKEAQSSNRERFNESMPQAARGCCTESPADAAPRATLKRISRTALGPAGHHFAALSPHTTRPMPIVLPSRVRDKASGRTRGLDSLSLPRDRPESLGENPMDSTRRARDGIPLVVFSVASSGTRSDSSRRSRRLCPREYPDSISENASEVTVTQSGIVPRYYQSPERSGGQDKYLELDMNDVLEISDEMLEPAGRHVEPPPRYHAETGHE